ncbi:hypothetical protein JVT61DRAFT_5605 [Boletus reticuloceps]|uniref:Uncharacterized protein n=1 Tax=Boletus reticuloceps TaxID=495285 RepID=A0A8I2Z2K8_9AGAM|nr:hypothetical protein JVT61DRAFT_5605 [Boletus reticuloceps]
MLTNISKATTLYFTPVLMLTSLFLILFAYLAPVVMLHSQVSLLTVVPSSVLTQPGSNQIVDGPSMFVGMLGSCAKPNNSATLICTSPSISPVYNASVFTSNTPSSVLAAPPTVAPAFLATSLAFSMIFFIMFTGISFRHLMGKAGNVWENPMVQRASAWIGIGSFLVGLASFLIIRIYFGKAASDFNQSIQGQGANGPQLIADTSNAFTMVWVGYAFFAVPVVVSLAKLHVLATK